MIKKSFDLYSAQYENVIMIDNFNVHLKQSQMKTFCDSLIKTPFMVATCYNSHQNPSCIDLILINSILSFQISSERETGLFYFHKITATVMKTTLPK